MSNETREELIREIRASLKAKTIDELQEFLALVYEMQEQCHENLEGCETQL